nr:hypothetical protein CFP56_50643 [Quercus suber]POE95479.1 hypothetical protein CFP56_01523 [Quercus suber]
MEHSIVEGLLNLRLTKEEEEEIAITTKSRADLLEECSLRLFGRLFTDRHQNQRALKYTLRSTWKMGLDLQIVEIWGLPFEHMSIEVGRELGNSLRKFIESNRRTGHSDQAKFMRIRVDLH